MSLSVIKGQPCTLNRYESRGDWADGYTVRSCIHASSKVLQAELAYIITVAVLIPDGIVPYTDKHLGSDGLLVISRQTIYSPYVSVQRRIFASSHKP